MPKNLGVDTFLDPVGHFGSHCWPFGILQAVRHCRLWASAPFATKLLFGYLFATNFRGDAGGPGYFSLSPCLFLLIQFPLHNFSHLLMWNPYLPDGQSEVHGGGHGKAAKGYHAHEDGVQKHQFWMLKKAECSDNYNSLHVRKTNIKNLEVRAKTAVMMKMLSMTARVMSNLWKVSVNSDFLQMFIATVFPWNCLCYPTNFLFCQAQFQLQFQSNSIELI